MKSCNFKFKKIVFGLILTLSLGTFVSCDFKGGSSNYTPSVQLARKPWVSGGDTLTIKLSNGAFVLDTVHVGDTINFTYYFSAFSNSIKTIKFDHSAEGATSLVWIQKDKLDEYLTTGTDYSRGLFYLKPDISSFLFSFKYVANLPSKSTELKATVVSDAVFDTGFGASNTTTLSIITPIKE